MSSKTKTCKASAPAAAYAGMSSPESEPSDGASELNDDMSWLEDGNDQNSAASAVAGSSSSSFANTSSSAAPKKRKGKQTDGGNKKTKLNSASAAAKPNGDAPNVLLAPQLTEQVFADARKAFRTVELSIHKQYPHDFHKMRAGASFEPYFEFTGACGEYILKDNARFKAKTISLNGLAPNASLYFMAMPGYLEDSCSMHGPNLCWTEMMSFPDWFLRFDKGKQRFNGNYDSNKWSTCPVFPIFVTEMTCDDGSRTYSKYQVPKGLAKQDQESCTTLQEWMDKCFDGFITLRSKKKVQQYFSQFASDFCFPTQDGKVTYQRTTGQFWRFPAFHSVSKLLSLCQISNKKKELSFGGSWLMMTGLVPPYVQKKRKKKKKKKKKKNKSTTK